MTNNRSCVKYTIQFKIKGENMFEFLKKLFSSKPKTVETPAPAWDNTVTYKVPEPPATTPIPLVPKAEAPVVEPVKVEPVVPKAEKPAKKPRAPKVATTETATAPKAKKAKETTDKPKAPKKPRISIAK
jgi:outer membrane biosynthesis protein TonB